MGVLKWKCIKQSPALADVIDSMADYYRACIGGYDEIVTFSEELNLIQKYIALMEFTHERSYPTDYRIEKVTIKSTPGEGTCVTLHIAFASIPNPDPNF